MTDQPGVTLEQILTRVKTRAQLLARRRRDDRIAPTDSDDAVLAQFAQDGSVEIARQTGRFEQAVRIPLVAGQAAYSVPIDVDRVQAATLGEQELEVVAGHEARQAAGRSSEGNPEQIGFYGSEAWLGRAPSAAFIEGLSEENKIGDRSAVLRIYALTTGILTPRGDGDAGSSASYTFALQLSRDLERVLVGYVLAEWYQATGEHAEAGQVRRRYLQALEEAKGKPRKSRFTARPIRNL